MTTLKEKNGGLPLTRPLFPDFFNADDFAFDRLWKKAHLYSVNICETDKTYDVELAAPGMRKEDFKIEVNRGILTISGTTEKKSEEKKKRYTRREFCYDSFARSFTLPGDAKEEGIKANYENGVLLLTIAKRDGMVSKAKQISVG